MQHLPSYFQRLPASEPITAMLRNIATVTTAIMMLADTDSTGRLVLVPSRLSGATKDTEVNSENIPINCMY